MHPTTSNALAIDVAQLSKHYGDVVAVDGIDLQVPAGQLFGLLGPNGSGKTSTINALTTLSRPSGGQAHIAGYDVLKQSVQVRQSIGLVFQDSALDRTLSVQENLRFAGMVHNMSDALIEVRINELLDLFDLGDKRHGPVAQLSGGMRRAVDVARGVIHYPKVLFLDEPTIGLDLPTRRKIWRFIDSLRQRLGMTVLLTTHYLEEAADADQVAFIRKGKIVARGEPHALVADLGQAIFEIEGDELDTLAHEVAGKLGKSLIEGDTAFFRVKEDVARLTAWVEDSFGARINQLRVRKPNLNDVFLWVTH